MLPYGGKREEKKLKLKVGAEKSRRPSGHAYRDGDPECPDREKDLKTTDHRCREKQRENCREQSRHSEWSRSFQQGKCLIGGGNPEEVYSNVKQRGRGKRNKVARAPPIGNAFTA